MNPSEERTVRYLSGSLLTSYADVVVVNALANLAATSSGAHITVRSARDLRLRDIQEGNYILIGGPGSNPRVSLFSDKLNFIAREGVVGQSLKFFENKHPRPGESATYQGLEFTGVTGVDYATISLLPLPSGHGNVLLVQGLQQEATEAAGMLLADLEGRNRLEQALGLAGDPTAPVCLRFYYAQPPSAVLQTPPESSPRGSSSPEPSETFATVREALYSIRRIRFRPCNTATFSKTGAIKSLRCRPRWQGIHIETVCNQGCSHRRNRR